MYQFISSKLGCLRSSAAVLTNLPRIACSGWRGALSFLYHQRIFGRFQQAIGPAQHGHGQHDASVLGRRYGPRSSVGFQKIS